MPCPECRTDFEIPKSGVADLPVRTYGSAHVCEVCSSELMTNNEPATMYCVDCSQKLCRRCSLPHANLRGGPHDVRALDTTSWEHRSGVEYCNEHNERVRMHCFNHQINVCSTCCIKLHKTCEYEEVDIVVHKFTSSVDHEIEQVASRVESFRGAVAQAEAETSKLLSNIQATENEIKDRGAEVNQRFTLLVDRQVSGLLQELQSLKSAAEKEVQLHTDTLQLAVTEMESFIASSLELRSKGSPSDITQAANDVLDRAKELLHTWVIPGEYHAPSYKFAPVNIDELLRDDQNLIGHVIRGEVPGTSWFSQLALHFQFGICLVGL